MTKNSGVKIRTGIMDTLSDKECRNCGQLMDNAGSHYVCLACGHKLEKTGTAASPREATAWEKQVADLQSAQAISARQAQSVQLMSGFGVFRALLFLGLLGLALAAPLQNLLPLVNGGQAGPQGLATAGVFLLVLGIAGWAAFSQPGPQRLLQRNLLGVLALCCLIGLGLSGAFNSLLAAQYGAMHNTVDTASGIASGIASVPALWQAPLLLGGSLAGLLLLGVICHIEASERPY